MNSIDVLNFSTKIFNSTVISLRIYIIAWLIGTLSGVGISCIVWFLPKRSSKRIYFFLSGISFIPITIWIPYFIRGFGLNKFIFPLLATPVALITFATLFEAFQHSNRHRLTLLVNYGQNRFKYFWLVVFRESMPIMKTTTRQTLSLGFAIFIALDFFVEYWNGLGGLVQYYYSRLGFGLINHFYMFFSIVVTGILGTLQVYLNDQIFKPWIEFRKHY